MPPSGFPTPLSLPLCYLDVSSLGKQPLMLTEKTEHREHRAMHRPSLSDESRECGWDVCSSRSERKRAELVCAVLPPFRSRNEMHMHAQAPKYKL